MTTASNNSLFLGLGIGLGIGIGMLTILMNPGMFFIASSAPTSAVQDVNALLGNVSNSYEYLNFEENEDGSWSVIEVTNGTQNKFGLDDREELATYLEQKGISTDENDKQSQQIQLRLIHQLQKLTATNMLLDQRLALLSDVVQNGIAQFQQQQEHQQRNVTIQ